MIRRFYSLPKLTILLRCSLYRLVVQNQLTHIDPLNWSIPSYFFNFTSISDVSGWLGRWAVKATVSITRCLYHSHFTGSKGPRQSSFRRFLLSSPSQCHSKTLTTHKPLFRSLRWQGKNGDTNICENSRTQLQCLCGVPSRHWCGRRYENSRVLFAEGRDLDNFWCKLRW